MLMIQWAINSVESRAYFFGTKFAMTESSFSEKSVVYCWKYMSEIIFKTYEGNCQTIKVFGYNT